MGGINNSTQHLIQGVIVDYSMTQLSFDYHMISSEVCTYWYDSVDIEVHNMDTGLLIGSDAVELCSNNQQPGWTTRTLSASAQPGDMLEISFEVITDVSIPSEIYIDNISTQ